MHESPTGLSRGGGRRGRVQPPASALVMGLLATVLLGLGSPCRATAQWRDTEIPSTQATLLADADARGDEVRLVEPLWLRRVRTFRRFGGVMLGVGGLVIAAGHLAFAGGASFTWAIAGEIAGSMIGGVGLFTLLGARVRQRRVRIHLGLRGPMPDHRSRRRLIGGGFMLGLTGVLIASTVRVAANGSDCTGDCEGSPFLVVVPAVLGSLLTVGGVSLLAAGGAARRGARGRVRISVGVARGVPTLMAQF